MSFDVHPLMQDTDDVDGFIGPIRDFVGEAYHEV